MGKTGVAAILIQSRQRQKKMDGSPQKRLNGQHYIENDGDKNIRCNLS